jgi:hypothetical protein
MIFRTIATFEKLDSNILDVMSKNTFYIQLLECYLFDGNPYSISSNKLSEDNSYIEIYVEYHSEQFYRMWYDEFKDKYISLIRLVLEEFKNLGIDVIQYFDNIDLPGLPEERKSIELFVSRFK